MNRNSLNFSIILIFNMTLVMCIQIIFEHGILNQLIGYSDWQLYIRSLRGETLDRNYGIFNILNSIYYIFGSGAAYFFYIFSGGFWVLLISKIQYKLLRAKFISGFLVTINPFVYILISGVFKETIIFMFLFLIYHFCAPFNGMSVFFVNFKKMIVGVISALAIFSIRPHFFGVFVVYLSRKFFLFLYIFLFFLVAFTGLIDFDFLKASFDEMQRANFSDLPVILIQDPLEMPLLIVNVFIIYFSFIWADNIIISVCGLFVSAAFFRFLQKISHEERRKCLFVFFVLIAPYGLFVSVSGTAVRLLSFAMLGSLIFWSTLRNYRHNV